MKLDLSEPLRWLGVKGEPDPALLAELSGVADRLTHAVTPRWVYRVFPVLPGEGGLLLEGAGLVLPGEMARRMLGDCSQAVLLACTLGAGFEAMLRAQQARSMARAAMLDACGSAWVEAGCDEAEREIAARFPGLYRTGRFSPGYGDLPLTVQRDICTVLDASRRLGLHVTESLLMNPSKSVTAVIGLADRPQVAGRPPDRPLVRQSAGRRTGRRGEAPMTVPPNDDPHPDGLLPARARGCAFCDFRETCQYRKEGITCGS